MVPMSFSYQMIGCSRFQEKVLDVRIKARGDCFFFPTTAPFSSRSGVSYFFAAGIATSVLYYLKAWHRLTK